jgi:hypothetical protein
VILDLSWREIEPFVERRKIIYKRRELAYRPTQRSDHRRFVATPAANIGGEPHTERAERLSSAVR